MADLLREKRRACGQHRALIGGGSSSSTASTQTTNQTDNRRTIASGGISAERSTVNVLDGGAVNRAFDFGTQALTFGVQSQQQAAATLDSTTSMVKNAYADAKGRGAMTDYIIAGAVALAGLVAVVALRKK